MEPISPDLEARLRAAVEAWAARRYGQRLKAVPAEHITVERSSSDSATDYVVTLNALVGTAPLRVKVVVGPDGAFQVYD
jgi:ABC-type transporter MlaC component